MEKNGQWQLQISSIWTDLEKLLSLRRPVQGTVSQSPAWWGNVVCDGGRRERRWRGTDEGRRGVREKWEMTVTKTCLCDLKHLNINNAGVCACVCVCPCVCVRQCYFHYVKKTHTTLPPSPLTHKQRQTWRWWDKKQHYFESLCDLCLCLPAIWLDTSPFGSLGRDPSVGTHTKKKRILPTVKQNWFCLMFWVTMCSGANPTMESRMNRKL